MKTGLNTCLAKPMPGLIACLSRPEVHLQSCSNDCFGSPNKTRVINMSVSRWNEEILSLVEEFADEKGMSLSDALFYLSERMLNQMSKENGGSQWHR